MEEWRDGWREEHLEEEEGEGGQEAGLLMGQASRLQHRQRLLNAHARALPHSCARQMHASRSGHHPTTQHRGVCDGELDRSVSANVHGAKWFRM
jgi:hypothetical protein